MAQQNMKNNGQKLPYQSPELQVVSVRIEERLLSCGRRRMRRNMMRGRRRRPNVVPVGKMS
ncbi:MAG: hypothetical protein MI702_02875 [Chlorobiales bacterium]|nr:hypothetical protein [Chlorobiales bacterium]